MRKKINTEEMIKLYEQDGLTMREIGDRYGLAGAFVQNVTLSLKTLLENPLKP